MERPEKPIESKTRLRYGGYRKDRKEIEEELSKKQVPKEVGNIVSSMYQERRRGEAKTNRKNRLRKQDNSTEFLGNL